MAQETKPVKLQKPSLIHFEKKNPKMKKLEKNRKTIQ
jgi:hypothetical protein